MRSFACSHPLISITNVAPMVAFLCHESCQDSGIIVEVRAHARWPPVHHQSFFPHRLEVTGQPNTNGCNHGDMVTLSFQFACRSQVVQYSITNPSPLKMVCVLCVLLLDVVRAAVKERAACCVPPKRTFLGPLWPLNACCQRTLPKGCPPDAPAGDDMLPTPSSGTQE